MHQLRRIALALGVATIVVGGVALGAGAAMSSPAGAPRVAATDNPGGGNSGPQQINPNIPLTQIPPFTKPPLTKSPGSKTSSAPKTSASTSASPSASKTSASPSRSATPSGSGRAGGGVGAVVNCTGATVTNPTVKVGTVGGKQALVDSAGCALYLNTQDTAAASVCTGDCLTTWLPVRAPAQAGDGVQQSNLGTFARPEGTQQVSYFGHQLYYFHGDTAPGQANGQGMNQVWYLVDPSGNPIVQ